MTKQKEKKLSELIIAILEGDLPTVNRELQDLRWEDFQRKFTNNQTLFHYTCKSKSYDVYTAVGAAFFQLCVSKDLQKCQYDLDKKVTQREFAKLRAYIYNSTCDLEAYSDPKSGVPYLIQNFEDGVAKAASSGRGVELPLLKDAFRLADWLYLASGMGTDKNEDGLTPFDLLFKNQELMQKALEGMHRRLDPIFAEYETFMETIFKPWVWDSFKTQDYILSTHYRGVCFVGHCLSTKEFMLFQLSDFNLSRVHFEDLPQFKALEKTPEFQKRDDLVKMLHLSTEAHIKNVVRATGYAINESFAKPLDNMIKTVVDVVDPILQTKLPYKEHYFEHMVCNEQGAALRALSYIENYLEIFEPKMGTVFGHD